MRLSALRHVRRIPAWALIAAGLLMLSALVSCRSTRPPAVEATPSATPSASPTPTATPTPTPLTDAQREFVDAYVKAVNAKDAQALRKLLLPKSLACYTKDTMSFLERWLKDRLRYQIPPDYTVRFSPITRFFNRSRALLSPAPPTDRMELTLGSNGQRPRGLAILVRSEAGRYYLLAPCISNKGLERFKASAGERRISAAKAREDYTKLRDPLRSQLTALLNQGNRPQARLLCQRELHLDSETAEDVLRLLEGREPY